MSSINYLHVAWLAGAVDGEGTVSIGRFRSSMYRDGLCHRPLLQLVNTDRRMLDHAASIIETVTGKRPKLYPLKRYATCHRPAWSMQIWSGWELALILPSLLPHLITKREQAETVLEFCKRQLAQRGGARRTDDAFAADELDYARCRILNQRGNHGGPPVEELERMLTLTKDTTDG